MRYQVSVEAAGDGVRILTVRTADAEQRFRLGGDQHADYLALHAELARVLDLREPASCQAPAATDKASPYIPLLTEPLSPAIPYGYGDPSVLRSTGAQGGAEWVMVVTSNDAPDAFPILRSDDLREWRHVGHVFPRGRTPPWALIGEDKADFWAPELHRVGDEYWLCFAARQPDRTLAIGLAKAQRPEGPYTGAQTPLLTGGVIDPHILIGPKGTPYLVWKVDDNGVWPPRLAAMLHARPALVNALFDDERDRRTAAFVAALEPWTRTLEPMEQFFAQQPLIEAAAEDFASLRGRIEALARSEDAELSAGVAGVLAGLKTRVFAQALSPAGDALVGEPTLVMENDLAWEAHLIEGVWTVEHEGRYFIFYAGNDFSTPRYGIGAAVADHPLGPYRKLPEPLLRSTPEWWGPGHPSVAVGPDGEHWMFLHAFPAGCTGYKAFRALLAARVRLGAEGVRLLEPPLS